MVGTGDMDRADERSENHLTTRRGFVTAIGFGVLSLYALWAGYGAAPIGLSLPSGEEGIAGGHGHGGGGMSPEEFRRLAEEFIEANELPDGSVKPARRALGARSGPSDHEREEKHVEASENGSPEAAEHGREKMHDGAPHGAFRTVDREHAAEDEPIDVYLMASRYSYEPSVLRLEVNVPYRFRMMGMDTNHGASITLNVRLAGHIMRSPAGTLAEMTMTFTKPGAYLIYCTVYCGEGHDMMQAEIIVT